MRKKKSQKWICIVRVLQLVGNTSSSSYPQGVYMPRLCIAKTLSLIKMLHIVTFSFFLACLYLCGGEVTVLLKLHM